MTQSDQIPRRNKNRATKKSIMTEIETRFQEHAGWVCAIVFVGGKPEFFGSQHTDKEDARKEADEWITKYLLEQQEKANKKSKPDQRDPDGPWGDPMFQPFN